MADRNPFIPSERRQDVEGRTHINEDKANRRFAEKEAKLREKAEEISAGKTAAQASEQTENVENAS